ncbi:MAG: 2-isopropylmalate synthase [Methermicoccaceae archaeon]
MRFLDTTLRDGEQTPGVSLTSDEKVLIAKKLDAIGVDVIEAGSAITSEGEKDAIRAVVGEGLSAEICSYCRIKREDIDAALSCDVDSIHLVAPLSDLHIEKKLKKDREWVRTASLDCIQYAIEHGLVVEYSAEDGSRADMDYAEGMFRDAIEHGAHRLCLCDTVGILIPEKTREIFSRLSKIGPMSVHCHDDYGLGTYNTVAAVLAGATQVHVTVNGIGERAGNTPLEEVALVLSNLYGYKVDINPLEFYSISRLVSRLTGVPVAPNKSMVGGNAFTHEAGIHVHGLLADTSTYEPITPESVGRKRRIVLGKHAGKASVVLALKDLDLKANEEQLNEIMMRIKDVGDRGKKVTDADFQLIAESVLNLSSKAWARLEELTVVSGTVTPTASIKLKVDSKETLGAGTGTGPVDAAINALHRALSGLSDVHLDEYHVDAITGGTDALVDVWVKMSKDKYTMTARGAHSDIIMASVGAVLQALNRLKERESKEGR